MQIVDLYRYEEKNRMVTVTPTLRAETDTPSMARLVADEKCTLTDGTREVEVIDVMLEDVDKWHEINTDNEATEADLKAQAYDILMGGE